MDAAAVVEGAIGGDHRAIDQLDTIVDEARAARDGARLDLFMSPLAVRASAGEEAARDLLLQLIDAHALCDAGIRRVFIETTRVEDARQEAMVAVVRGISGFSASSRFTTWLFSVSNNAAKQMLRSESRRDRRNAEAEELELVTRSTQRLSSMIATRSAVDAAIAALPDDFRSVVVMREVEDRSYQDIADALEVEIGTVKSRLRRGRERVAAVLAGAS